MLKVSLIIAVLLCVAVCGVSAEDEQSLTITLEPTEEAQAEQKDDLRLQHETLGATRRSAEQQGQQPARSNTQSSGDVIVSRLGVTTAKVNIFSGSERGSARVLYACPKGTFLGILGEAGPWYGVLMIDSSLGWVEKGKVRLLDYQAVVQDPQVSDMGLRIVNTALLYLGIPYKWGGYSLRGLDCSGFVKAVYASNGFSLPRTAREQVRVGAPIGWTQLRPGDRLYFACKGAAIDHAGIYIGYGLFIHSSTGRGGVAIDSILSRKFLNSLVAARR